MMRTVLVMTAVAIGITAVMAQGDPIAQRKSLMKSNSQSAGELNKMVKGEEPFDAAKAAGAYAKLADNITKLKGLFASPPPAGADTRALPKIWEAKADFDAKMTAFEKAVADNKGKATTLEALKASFPAVSKTCGDCHEPYRKPAPAGGKKK
jgi:cytochrome c556